MENSTTHTKQKQSQVYERQSRHYFGKKLFFVLSCLLTIVVFSGFAEKTPVLLSGDTLTFYGGAIDPENPDIYTINMGEPDLSENAQNIFYPITIKRPRGAGANYPVSVFYEWNRGVMSVTANVVKEQKEHNGGTGSGTDTLTFAAGEMEKEIYIHIPVGGEMIGSKEALYIFFSPVERTRIAQQVLEVVFTNPNPPTVSERQQIAGYMFHEIPTIYNGIDQYALVVFEFQDKHINQDGGTENPQPQYANITNNQILTLAGYNIDHNTLPAGTSEMDNPDLKQLTYLKPRLVGSTNQSVAYLYKIAENHVVTDYLYDPNYEGNPKKIQAATYKYEYLSGVKEAGPGGDEIGFALSKAYGAGRLSLEPKVYNVKEFLFNFYPRFGTVSPNKTGTYKKGEVVTLTVPFLNAKLYQKVFGSEWLNHIFVTLDGSSENPLPNRPRYNAATGNLTISFNAPNETGGLTTIYPEIYIRRYLEDYYDWERWLYPQGAFAAITVSTEEADPIYTKSISITGLPDQNRLFIGHLPYTILNYDVLPANCSFLNAKWTSSNPDVLEITQSGELIPKQRGKAIITLTSDEVEYRAKNNMQSNDGVLIKTVEISVKDFPVIKHEHQWLEKNIWLPQSMTIENNILACGWKPTGTSRVTFTHIDGQYAPIVVDTILTQHIIDSNGELNIGIPFNEKTFPMLSSPKNEMTGIARPICTINFSIPIVDDEDGDTDTLTYSAPVYMRPFLRLYGYGRDDLGYYREGGSHIVNARINCLSKNEFYILITIQGNEQIASTGDDISGTEFGKTIRFSYPMDTIGKGLPEWLTLTPYGEETYRADIRYPLEINQKPPADGRMYKIEAEVYVVNTELMERWAKFECKSRIRLIGKPEESELSMTYRSLGGNKSYPLDKANWKTNNGDELSSIKKHIDYSVSNWQFPSSYVLDEFGQKSMVKAIRITSPSYWGIHEIWVNDELIFTGGKRSYLDGNNMTFDEFKANVPVGENPTYGPYYLKLPKPGVQYKIEIKWPQVNIKRDFEYSWNVPEIRNLRDFKVSGKYVLPTPNVTLDYDGKTHKFAMYPTERYFCVEGKDADTVKITSDQYVDTYMVTAKNYNYHYSEKAEVSQTIPIANWYVRNQFAPITLTLGKPKLHVKLVDQAGKSISNAKVNYMVECAEGPLAGQFTGENKTKTTADISSDGTCTIEFETLDDRAVSYRIYMEVVAEGYHPQVHTFDYTVGFRDSYSNAGVNYKTEKVTTVLLKKDTNKRMYSSAVLKHESSKYGETPMHNLALGSVTPYEPALYDGNNNPTDMAYMDIATVWNYDSGLPKLGSEPGFKWDPVSTLVEYKKAKYTQFENSYVEVRYKLQKGLEPFTEAQKATTIYLYNGTTVAAQLPMLMNNDPLPPPMPPFNVPGDDEMDGESVTDSDADLGKTKGNFDALSVATPESLPFAMKVEKNGNEWIIRGAVHLELLSSGYSNKVNNNNFDSMFGQLKDKVKSGWSSSPDVSKTGDIKATVSGYVEGKGTYNPNTKQIENVSFYAGGIGAELSVEIKKSIKFAGIAEFGVALGGAFATAVHFSQPDENRRTETYSVDLIIDNSLSLYLKAWAQLGIDIGIASAKAGVVGEGRVTITNRIEKKVGLPTRTGIKTALTARIDLYARAHFLCWEKDWKKNLVDVGMSFLVPDNSSNPFKDATKNTTRLLSDRYKAANLRAINPDFSPIIRDINAYADPRYILGGSSMVFSNINTIQDNNDDRIQLYSGGDPVDIDATAQNASFNFDAVSTTDKAVVAYEQMNGEISVEELSGDSDEAMTKLAARVDIMAAVGNGKNWTVANLSNNEYANMNPKATISEDGSKAVVIWNSGLLTHKTFIEDGDEITAEYMRGEVLMSRYDGTAWKEPVAIASLTEEFQLNEYQAVFANDTVLIVAVSQTPTRESIAEGNIVTLSVANDSTVRLSDTRYRGHNPQIKRIGNENIITFLSAVIDTVGIKQEIAEDDTYDQDVYLMAVSNEGLYEGGLSEYVGLAGRNIQNYKLVSDLNPVGVNSLSLIWSEPSIVEKEDDPEGFIVETNVYAARLGRWNSRLFASEPLEVVTVPKSHWVSSFDAFTENAEIKTVITLANENSGAEIIEEELVFSNAIEPLKMNYIASDLQAGIQLPVEFTVKNTGYAPVTSLDIIIGKDTTKVETELMPGKSEIYRGYHNISKDFAGMDYKIDATFAEESQLRATPLDRRINTRAATAILRVAGGSRAAKSGSKGISVVDMSVSELSNMTEGTATTILVEVSNKSPFPLKETDVVKVGLYKDPYGNDPYPGAAEKTFSHAELYNVEDSIGRTAVAAFEIETALKETLVYAIVSTENERGEPIEDQTIIDNLTIIRLYPDPDKVTLVSNSLPDGVVGEPYSATLEAGGVSPFTWTIESGSLPDGLELEAETGVISGTPTREGTFNFDAKAANSIADDTKALSIKITKSTGLNGDDENLNSLKVHTTKNGLHITGLIPGEELRLFDVQGILFFYKSEVADSEIHIPLSQHGVYIVVSGEERTKAIY